MAAVLGLRGLRFPIPGERLLLDAALLISLSMATYTRCLALALTLAAHGSSVHAQTTSPTDTDLRAAYCAETDKRQLAGVQTMEELANSNPSTDPRVMAARISLAAQLARLQSDEAKLSAYVAGRRLHIEPTLMLAAARSADADFDAGVNAIEHGDMGALDAASARADERCHDLSWFPF